LKQEGIKNLLVHQRFCSICLNLGLHHIENEYHFIGICPAYIELRQKYITLNNQSTISYYNFLKLLKSKNSIEIVCLSQYIFTQLN